MLSNYSPVADTPEIQRIKTTQQNISSVSSHYFFLVLEIVFCTEDLPSLSHLFFCITWIFYLYYLYFFIMIVLKLQIQIFFFSTSYSYF